MVGTKVPTFETALFRLVTPEVHDTGLTPLIDGIAHIVAVTHGRRSETPEWQLSTQSCHYAARDTLPTKLPPIYRMKSMACSVCRPSTRITKSATPSPLVSPAT